MVTTAPFVTDDKILADTGLHALARRFERTRPNDDGAVLADLKALIDGYRAAIAKGGSFEIPTKKRREADRGGYRGPRARRHWRCGPSSTAESGQPTTVSKGSPPAADKIPLMENRTS
jgi:hypothetical protein